MILVFELTGGVKTSWPKSGQLSTDDLIAKYVFLLKIRVVNWCPSSHTSSLAMSFASLLYRLVL